MKNMKKLYILIIIGILITFITAVSVADDYAVSPKMYSGGLDSLGSGAQMRTILQAADCYEEEIRETARPIEEESPAEEEHLASNFVNAYFESSSRL